MLFELNIIFSFTSSSYTQFMLICEYPERILHKNMCRNREKFAKISSDSLQKRNKLRSLPVKFFMQNTPTKDALFATDRNVCINSSYLQIAKLYSSIN